MRSQRERLERALRDVEQHLPRLSPQTNVPGAELRVDGVLVGRLPLSTPWVLASGSGVLELSAPGHRSLRRTVSLAEGEVFREMLTLSPESSAVAVDATRTSAAAERPTAPVVSPSVALPARQGPGVGPWIVAGTGVALVALGGVFWALRESAVGNCTVEAEAIACPTSADVSRAQGAAGMGIAANVSLGVGIAATAGGVLWMLLGRPREQGARAVRVGVTPLARGGEVSVGGSF
ncbi:MAG: PEGA domain-containing protein [Polyangiales bacterium]